MRPLLGKLLSIFAPAEHKAPLFRTADELHKLARSRAEGKERTWHGYHLCGVHGRELILSGLHRGCDGAQEAWDYLVGEALDGVDAPTLAKLKVKAYTEPPVSNAAGLRLLLETYFPG